VHGLVLPTDIHYSRLRFGELSFFVKLVVGKYFWFFSPQFANSCSHGILYTLKFWIELAG